jgi:hypothetical protein
MGGRIGTLFLAVALAAASTAWTQAPKLDASRLAGLTGVFSPGEADFTVVMATQESGPLRPVRQTIRQHGPWLRIDILDGDVTRSRYIYRPSGVAVDVTGGYLGLTRPDLSARSTNYRSFPTGRTQRVAGERCQEWDIYRGLEDGKPTYRRLGCVTSDGVELSRRSISASGSDLGYPATATSVSRAPVAPTEVQPSAAYDPRAWAPTPPTDDGWQVFLSGESGSRTIRARGDWRYTDTRRPDDSRVISSVLASAGFQAHASLGRDGVPITASIMARPGVVMSLGEQRLDMPDETILGHPCAWYNTAPGLSDGFYLECRMDEGPVLKMVEGGRGGRTTYVAISLVDKPPTTSEMMLSPALFDLASWPR